MSSQNFVGSRVEHEYSFITSGPDVNKTNVHCCRKIFPSYVIGVQPHEITKYETCAILHRFHILYISCDRSTSQQIILVDSIHGILSAHSGNTW